MAGPLVYLNGQYVDYAGARVPVEDRGLQFADGVYEVFVSGTNAELGPVIEVDGRQIGTGQPGPIFEKVLAAFDVATGQRQPVSAGSG